MNVRIHLFVLAVAVGAASCQTPQKTQPAAGRRPSPVAKANDRRAPAGTQPAGTGKPRPGTPPAPTATPAGEETAATPGSGVAATQADRRDVAVATQPDSSSTQPASAAAAGELLQPTADMAGYGEESYRIVSGPDEVIAVLKNGATVIAKRVASPAVSVRGYAHTGGVYEGRWLGGGLSHLLEHLVAGGSNAKRSEEQNRDLLQQIGNDSNAYTTNDHTAYFINTTSEHMESAVDLVCNWMLGATITEQEYRREYLVVQRELEMGKGEPDRVFYYMTAANRYRASPARVPVIGYQEVIQGLSRDDVYEYYKLAYVPNNLVFAVAGDVDPERMLAAVKQQVKHAKPGRDFGRDVTAEPPVLAPRTLVGTFAKLGQAKLQLAFPTVRLTHPDLYALDLLATALGSGESSLFTEELRDKRKLVSAVSVASDTPSYVEGAFQVDLELDAANVPDATKAVLELVEQVKRQGVDPQRLARAKTQMRAAMVKRLQTAKEVASQLATDFLAAGDPHFQARYVDRIDQVTPEQVTAAAARYFDTSRLLTTSLLPTEFAPTLPKAEELLRPVTPAATQTADAGKSSEVVRVDLGGGATLLVKRVATSPLVSMQMYSLGGLTAEDDRTNGLGNLTMQMLARGTQGRTAQQIAEFWDSIGGEFAADCGNNSWSWTATCLTADFDKALAAFAEQVARPTFPADELPLAKRRVVAKIQSQDADWASAAFRFFKKTYYGPMGSPYQYMNTGSIESVERYTAEQVRDWYAGKVLTGRRVIAVYGDVDPAAAEQLVRARLQDLPPAAADAPDTRAAAPTTVPTTAPVLTARPPSTQPTVEVEHVAVNKTEQALAGVVVGFRADSVIGEPATFPLAVGDTMASGYQYGSGYLYEILRGRGLVYVVHGQNSPGLSPRLPGTFLVYAGCEPGKVNEVVDVILENIARLQGTPADVNEDWFRRSKELIVVAEALDSQTPAQQATQAALDELYGLGFDWHRRFATSVRSVTLGDVQETATNRLRRCVVTVSTPSPDSVMAKPGRREYPSFPKVELTPRGIQHDAGK